MKRINISIDVEDAVFEQEVGKAVKAYARQIARETVEKEIQAEIARIAQGLLSNLAKENSYSQLAAKVAKELASTTTYNLLHGENKAMLDKAVTTAVEKQLDAATLHGRIRDAANSVISGVVKTVQGEIVGGKQ